MKKLMEMGSDKKPAMDDKAKAKMKVLMDLKKMAADMMGEDLSEGMKKVTVAAPDSESMKAGLEKAEELMEEADDAEMDEMPDGMAEMMGDDDEDEMMEEEMSPEDIEAEIARLMEMKAKMKEA